MTSPFKPSMNSEATSQAQQDADETIGLSMRRLSGFQPRPVRWQVKNYVALGKLHLTAGDGGEGKGIFWLTAIADFTTGRATFGLDYEPPPPCEAILMSAEDDPEDTIVPRLLAAGADCDKVHFVEGVKVKDGKPQPFTLAHFKALDAELRRHPEVKI